ncbi:MAG TPA: methyltransferase domain-containing protein, partial [Puia sp.]|nr:methyltransferase domain-containing protein [Puia sp.]
MGNAISTWKKRARIALRIISKKFFQVFGTLNILFQPNEKFCIKKGYHHTGSANDFDDTSNTDEWQQEVYILAKDLLTEKGFQSVIDIGCGSGYKLIHYFGSYKTIGIEVGKTYHWLKHNYARREWLLFDETNPTTLHTDLIICSDVIEHIKNPDSLVAFIRGIHSKQIIFSTPERNGIAGKKDYGPPENLYHYREWN